MQSLHFARNRDVALVLAGSANVERPHAKRVARNVHQVALSVNEHQRKHAVQLPQRGLHVAVEQAVQVDDHFAIRPAHVSVRQSVPLNELPVVVNLAVANQLASQQKKGLVSGGGESVDGKPVEPDATLILHNEPAVIRTPVRDFSKTVLQQIQLVHGNALGANRLIIKNAAHVKTQQRDGTI